LQPTFPLKCDFCDATHPGDTFKAIADKWRFAVYMTTEGIVQMAGCPNHIADAEEEMHDFLHDKGKRTPKFQALHPLSAEGKQHEAR